jgi:hypothetical protein
MQKDNNNDELGRGMSILDRVGTKVFVGDKVAVGQGWGMDVMYVYKVYGITDYYTNRPLIRALFCNDLSEPFPHSHTTTATYNKSHRIIKLNN